MPVIEIAGMNLLRQDDRLDGRAVAVKGYWIKAIIPSCPAPPHFLSPLEQWCRFEVFSSQPYQGKTCTEFADHSECHGNVPPGGAVTVEPFTLTETQGSDTLWSEAPGTEGGVPAILIMHSNDPRAWQCRPESAAACHHAVVVDRVAWANGNLLDWNGPQPTWIATERRAEEVRTLDPVRDPIALFPILASEASMIDPRLQVTGADPVWIARTIRAPADVANDDPTVPIDVWLIDDANGKAITTLDLDVGDDYQPGRFRTQSLVRREPPNTSVTPAYSIGTADGEHVQFLGTTGWSSGGGAHEPVRHMAGLAALLDSGTYVVHGWRAEWEHQFMGDRLQECTASFEIAAGQDLVMEAFFDDDEGECQWREPTFDDTL
ncbi:MAG TPA: hypothetical protein VMZ66_04150 [Aeromicrobium sp.]|nr:hypothetical protein [Aeromicrobium sp.]